eukprot:2599285-Prymnesium_polylepis.1
MCIRDSFGDDGEDAAQRAAQVGGAAELVGVLSIMCGMTRALTTRAGANILLASAWTGARVADVYPGRERAGVPRESVFSNAQGGVDLCLQLTPCGIYVGARFGTC